MHSGGSMTGGSIQQKAQNLLGREREMQELKESFRQLNQRAEEAQADITRMEEQRAGEKERRESAQYDLHQQEIAVVRDTERLKAAQADQDAHNARMESYQAAIAQLDESLEQIARELQRIEQESTQETESTDELNARTETLSASLNTARRQREAAQEALTDAMLTLQNAQHDVERMQRDRSRLTEDAAQCRQEIAALGEKRHQARQDVADATQHQAEAEGRIAACERAVEEARAHVEDVEQQRAQKQRQLRDIQDEIDAAQQTQQHETDRQHRQEMALSRIRAEATQLSDRLWNTYELSHAGAVEALEAINQQPSESGEDLSGQFDEGLADAEAGRIRDRIRQMGSVNVSAIEEYAQMYERFTQLDVQKTDLERAKADLQALITQLLSQMETVFVGQFGALQGYFAETFTRLFGGGYGEISLSDPEDPLNCGIEIIVQPPGKKRQLLSLFSGGERALTAIAILFAMLKLKPTPFCILDEIEAALDDANISYFADYLKEFSKDTQFIVVTHRKGTMERCDTLFGVAMEERGVSSMVSVNLTDYE